MKICLFWAKTESPVTKFVWTLVVDIVPGRKKLDFPRRMVLLSNKFPWNIWLVHESFGGSRTLCKKYIVVSKLFSEKFSTLTWIFCHHSKIQSMRSSSHKTIPGGLIATKILNRHKHYTNSKRPFFIHARLLFLSDE